MTIHCLNSTNIDVLCCYFSIVFYLPQKTSDRVVCFMYLKKCLTVLYFTMFYNPVLYIFHSLLCCVDNIIKIETRT